MPPEGSNDSLLSHDDVAASHHPYPRVGRRRGGRRDAVGNAAWGGTSRRFGGVCLVCLGPVRPLPKCVEPHAVWTARRLTWELEVAYTLTREDAVVSFD